MNRGNITKVRDVIAALPRERFTMNLWSWSQGRRGHDVEPDQLLVDCKTCGCIGGWTAASLTQGAHWCDTAQAARLLGLSKVAGHALFYPDREFRSSVTPPQAVRVLDILLETGEVDWERAIREVPAKVEAA